MARRIAKVTPLACATNRGYDPWLALCVATIKRAKLDHDADFFRNPMYEIMLAYCHVSVPGFFPREAELVLPDGVEL